MAVFHYSKCPWKPLVSQPAQYQDQGLAQWSAFINAINYMCISRFDKKDTIFSVLYSK